MLPISIALRCRVLEFVCVCFKERRGERCDGGEKMNIIPARDDEMIPHWPRRILCEKMLLLFIFCCRSAVGRFYGELLLQSDTRCCAPAVRRC